MQIKDGSNILATQTAVRPNNGGATTLTFNTLPVRTLTVISTAYPNANGTGTPLSTGTISIAVQSGKTASQTLTMASTIDHLAVDYNRTDLLQGETATVNVTAYDAANAVLLLTPGAVQWSSSDTNKISTTATGTSTTLTGVGAGPATITVTDSESNKQTTFQVLGMTFTLSPSTPTLSVNDPQTFNATIAGPTDTSVTWTVVDNGGGSIGSNGNYTASAAPGTYHIKAVSNFDPTRSRTATVTVQAGNLHLGVN